ncbi:hypothetical protein [Ornithinimicrobium avium]|uniref:Uncharacterized protein n=1 Tax=Ornithinimicrobium avium TaxID=2283195 RepID=A0A345NIK8_9MICO|nr:hypothetical protein [Ornithinimicrobium avium]AXH94866.1 hypothetical protein DV701_00535 [Ornithinimicrobium avium]
MLALFLAILFCVAVGLGIVGYVLLEARREGRGEFWTAEGEELIAGARRTTDKVRHRGERLGRSAAERTRDLAARLPERGADRRSSGDVADAGPAGDEPQAEATVVAERDGQDGYRAAS